MLWHQHHYHCQDNLNSDDLFVVSVNQCCLQWLYSWASSIYNKYQDSYQLVHEFHVSMSSNILESDQSEAHERDLSRSHLSHFTWVARFQAHHSKMHELRMIWTILKYHQLRQRWNNELQDRDLNEKWRWEQTWDWVHLWRTTTW